MSAFSLSWVPWYFLTLPPSSSLCAPKGKCLWLTLPFHHDAFQPCCSLLWPLARAQHIRHARGWWDVSFQTAFLMRNICIDQVHLSQTWSKRSLWSWDHLGVAGPCSPFPSQAGHSNYLNVACVCPWLCKENLSYCLVSSSQELLWYPQAVASAVVMKASKTGCPGVLTAPTALLNTVPGHGTCTWQPTASGKDAVCPFFPFQEQVSTASISPMQTNPSFRIWRILGPFKYLFANTKASAPII